MAKTLSHICYIFEPILFFWNRLPYIMMSLREDRNGTATGAASLSKACAIVKISLPQSSDKLNQTLLHEQSYDTVWTY